MSLKASAWAWDMPVNGLTKLVLLAIADYAGRDNDSAWPSMDTLATRCGISRMTAVRAIRELQDKKLLEVESRANRTNLYRLPVADPEGYHSDRGYHTDTTVVPHRYSGSTTQIPKPVTNQLRTSHIPESEVEAIYDAYPRKVGRPNALKAIRKALKLESAKKEHGLSSKAFLEKTKLWATACEQRIAKDPEAAQYIKHPATWFNQQCYLEPTSEWGIKAAAKTGFDRDAERIAAQADEAHKRIMAEIDNL